MSPKLQRAIATIAITFGVLAVASPAFAADTTTPTAPNGNALKTYQACMKKQGVKVKLPSFSGRPPGGANGAPSGGAPSGEFTPPTGNGNGASGGIPGGGPFGKPKGVSTKKYNAAQKACAGKLPSFGAGGANGQGSQDFQAYLSCLSDHGVKVPTSGGLAGLDRNDPTFQTANQTCGTLLPSGAAPGAGGSNST
jgi:hypothetical protein